MPSPILPSQMEHLAPGTRSKKMSPEQKRRLLKLLSRQAKSESRKSIPVRGASPVSRSKAREILRDGTVRGRPLTRKQRGLFGVIASGRRPTRLSE